jgi:hypothetical protein
VNGSERAEREVAISLPWSSAFWHALEVFSRSALERAMDLQRRSYALLVWMGNAIRKGFILFDTVGLEP